MYKKYIRPLRLWGVCKCCKDIAAFMGITVEDVVQMPRHEAVPPLGAEQE